MKTHPSDDGRDNKACDDNEGNASGAQHLARQRGHGTLVVPAVGHELLCCGDKVLQHVEFQHSFQDEKGNTRERENTRERYTQAHTHLVRAWRIFGTARNGEANTNVRIILWLHLEPHLDVKAVLCCLVQLQTHRGRVWRCNPAQCKGTQRWK